jgi:hypothetical protein
MKVTEAINKVNLLKPSAYTESQLMEWLNELEGKVQKEAFGFMFDDIVQYDWAADGDTELLIYKPYDETYVYYIMAKIDYANQEMNSYTANMTFANDGFTAFKADMKRNNREVKNIRISNYY